VVVSFFVVIRFYFYGDQGSLDGDRVSLYVDQVSLHGTNRLMVTGQVFMLARPSSMVTGAVLMVTGSASRNFLKERHLAVVINNFFKNSFFGTPSSGRY